MESAGSVRIVWEHTTVRVAREQCKNTGRAFHACLGKVLYVWDLCG